MSVQLLGSKASRRQRPCLCLSKGTLWICSAGFRLAGADIVDGLPTLLQRSYAIGPALKLDAALIALLATEVTKDSEALARSQQEFGGKNAASRPLPIPSREL